MIAGNSCYTSSGMLIMSNVLTCSPSRRSPRPLDDDRQFIVSVERGLRLLQELARSPGGATNSELAERIGLARSTISRLVHTLRTLGYLTLDPSSRRYVLTPKVLTLGYSVLSDANLLRTVRPGLQHIAEMTGETTALAVHDGLYATFVGCARGGNMLAVQIETGARLPMASSASGLALLKAMPEDERKRLIFRLRRNMREHKLDDASFDRRLKAALKSEIVIVCDAWHQGIGGIAVPVRLGNDIGAIAIAVSTAVVSEDKMRHELGRCLLDTVRDFQIELAH